MVLDPVAYLSPAILPRMFLDFPFFLKVGLLWEQSTTRVCWVPPENLNFKGMVALPLTPYPSIKRLMGQPYDRATERGRVEIMDKGRIGIEP